MVFLETCLGNLKPGRQKRMNTYHVCFPCDVCQVFLQRGQNYPISLLEMRASPQQQGGSSRDKSLLSSYNISLVSLQIFCTPAQLSISDSEQQRVTWTTKSRLSIRLFLWVSASSCEEVELGVGSRRGTAGEKSLQNLQVPPREPPGTPISLCTSCLDDA